MTPETSLATSLYAGLRQGATTPSLDGNASAGSSFSQTLAEAARALEASLGQAETSATASVSGTGDMQGLVEALSSAKMAVETAVVMRDRVVEAYQEILRMPV
ncbi:MAG: flagellar hook-basal body complex protein FliE [Pseudomonadota bacterium]